MTAAVSQEVLVSRRQLSMRIKELGAELSAHYEDAPDVPIFVGVLKGSTMFLADLVRELRIDCQIDFMSISSYRAGDGGAGVVRIVKDLETDVTGRDVLVVEDIVDTGLTLNYLRRSLSQRRPRSLQAVTLLDKSARRIVPVPLEHKGFEVPDVFVVGYGLDFQGRYRNASEIIAIRDVARLANDPELLVSRLFLDR